MPLNLNIFDPDHRFGATALARSRDPARQKQGIALLGGIDKRAELRAESEAKAREATQGVFLQILENGLKTGFAGTTNPQDTFRKVVDGATGGKFVGELPPVESLVGKEDEVKRVVEIVKAGGGTLDAGSMLDAARGAGVGALRIGTSEQKERDLTTVSPGAMVIDEEGNLVFENKNKRQGASTGFKQGVLSTAERNFQELEAKAGSSNLLSDRLALARARVELQVARGLTTPSTGDKIKGDLNKRAAALARYDNSASTAMKILETNPASVTAGGGAAKAIKSIGANLEGLMEIIPNWDSDLNINESSGQWSDELDRLAGDNAEMRSILYNLALQSAIADGLSNQRLSNQMIEQALQNMGANASNPKQIVRKLAENRRRIADSLDVALKLASDQFTDLDRPDPTAKSEITPEQAIQMLRERGMTDEEIQRALGG